MNLRIVFILLIYVFFSFQSSAQIDTLYTADDIFNMSMEELMAVKVSTHNKSEVEIKDIPANVVVIDRFEIEALGYKNVPEVLEYILGIYLIDDYNWLSSLNFGIRGFFSPGAFSDVIILLNGVNQVVDTWGHYPFAKINIPIESIDKIELVKGPMSVEYGSGAFFGAINIITNDNTQSDKNIISANTSFSSKDVYSKSFFARLNSRNDVFSYSLNAAYEEDVGLDIPYSDLTGNLQSWINIGLPNEASTHKQMESLHKYINLNTKFNDFELNIALIDSKNEIFDGLPAINDGNESHTESYSINVSYSKSFLKKFKVNAKASYYNDKYHIIYNQLITPFASNFVETSSYEFETKLFYYPNEYLDVNFGFFRRSVLEFFKSYDYPGFGDLYSNAELFLNHGDNVSANAFFTEIKFKIKDKLSISGGLRFEMFEKYEMTYSRALSTPFEFTVNGAYNNNKINVIPSIAFIYKPNSMNLFKVMLGKAIKHPSIEQNSNMFLIDKPQLNPAEIQTREVAYILSLFKKNTITISLFDNYLSNLILRKNVYNSLTQEWDIYSENTGAVSTRGVEFNLSAFLTERIHIIAGVSYLQTNNEEDELKDIKAAYAPSILGNLKIVYAINQTTSISFMSRYVDAMEAMWDYTPLDPENNNFSPVGRIGKAVKSYYIMDFNLRVSRIFNTGVYFNFKISNILDTEIRYPTTKSNSWIDKGTIGPGRLFTFKMGYHF